MQSSTQRMHRERCMELCDRSVSCRALIHIRGCAAAAPGVHAKPATPVPALMTESNHPVILGSIRQRLKADAIVTHVRRFLDSHEENNAGDVLARVPTKNRYQSSLTVDQIRFLLTLIEQQAKRLVRRSQMITTHREDTRGLGLEKDRQAAMLDALYGLVTRAGEPIDPDTPIRAGDIQAIITSEEQA